MTEPASATPPTANSSTSWNNTEATLASRDPKSSSRGRVHWGGEPLDPITSPIAASDAAPASAGRRIQIQGDGGATVTVRGAGGAPSTGMQRAVHPGPLQLSSRLNANSEAAAGPFSAPAEEAPAKHAETQQQLATELSLTGAKGLDEQGLDSRAFLELQRELQRHEASSELDINPGGDQLKIGAIEAALARQQREQDRARRRAVTSARFETPEFGSGASTPGTTDMTSESGSYDPAADSDLDHLEITAGEVDGMPSKPKKNRNAAADDGQAGGSEVKGWGKLRALMKKSKEGDEESQAQQPGPRTYEEGGPTNLKSVPVTTSSGTHPGGPRSRPTRFEREAAKLVRAHRLMQGQAGGGDSLGGAAGVSRIPTINRGHLDSGSSTPDPLDTNANLDARPLQSGGVLGNLLKLYEQQQREQKRQEALRQSGGISAATSPMSSHTDLPAVSGANDANLSDLVEAELRREQQQQQQGVTVPGAVATSSISLDSSRRRSRSMFTGDGAITPGRLGTSISTGGARFAGASRKVLETTVKETGIDDAFDDRPKAARSSAGVFGALIATTGNFVGAVSPNHAQLGPNPKRPGYTLDRYILPEMNAKTLKRTAQLVADAAPRPLRSQPGSPGTRSPHGAASPVRTPDEKPRPGQTHRKSGHFSNWSKGWTHSTINTPDVLGHESGDYFGTPEMDEKLMKQEWQRKLRKRAKDKRRKEEVFITMHVAAILQRQEFLLKLARALMMFGAPTHRIETQIQQTARVLEINCRCIYLPNLMLLAFGDDTTHTSETKFIKQGGGLDLTKLTDMHTIYWNVIHDKIGVDEASVQLDDLMRRKPFISRWPMTLVGGFCSAFIAIGPMGFNGSLIDALVAFPLGSFLVLCQQNITTELFSNVFEIMFACINSFVASALASTPYFCFAGVVSGSIVLILPGFIVLSGALELQSKNIIAGSVRLVYAIIYSLFLGIGLSIGSSFWLLVSGSDTATFDVTVCTAVQANQPAYRASVPLAWAFLTVPGYAAFLSLRNQAKPTRKEFPVMIAIACAGWAVNHFASTAKALKTRQDITSALGSLTVGILANIYGRIFDGRSYVVSVTGILYQLPSGLSNGGGLLNFARSNGDSTASFSSGFTVAQSLVQVALGLTVGLFASTILAYVLGGKKIRGGGMFSF